jgi:hypothetical protein
MKQLRFTTRSPYSFISELVGEERPDILPIDMSNVGKVIETEIKGVGAYIHDEAEDLAGFDIPTFLDGDLGQLDLPINEQDILMILPSGEYPCKAELQLTYPSKDKYLITLKQIN